MKNFFRHLAIPSGWFILICALYSIPGFDLNYEDPWKVLTIDKFVHAGMFMIFVATLLVFFRKQSRIATFYIHPQRWAIIIALLTGLVLEMIQGIFFVMRTSDIMDFVSNAIGVLLGIIFFRVIYGKELSRF